MNQEEIIEIEDEIIPTHNFVYDNKQFPFNFSFFENSSLYFQKNRDLLFPKKEINILDEDKEFVKFTDDDINTFILFIHRKKAKLTKKNVYSLLYLSEKYIIQSLKKVSEDFIQKNNLCLQYLIFHQNDSRSNERQINQISDHFSDYVHDENMLKLNFHILYLIIEKVKNKRPPSEFIDFLFLCLDAYGRRASVLFQNVDFAALPITYFNTLLSYDKSKFDPVFISKEVMKNIYDKEGEIIQREENIKMKENQIEMLIASFQSRIDELERRSQEQQQIIENLTEKLKFIKIFIKRKYLYDPNKQNAFDGIIKNLSNRIGGKNIHDEGIVNVTMPSIFSNRLAKYAVDLNDKSKYAQSNNTESSYLKYDFKEKKVRPTHYSIRSRNDGSKGYYNLKNWVIEGSNTDKENDWTILDERNDIEYLDDKDALHTFEITNNIPNDVNFRYLRLRLVGYDSSNRYHYLTISALEYFGYLYE